MSCKKCTPSCTTLYICASLVGCFFVKFHRATPSIYIYIWIYLIESPLCTGVHLGPFANQLVWVSLALRLVDCCYSLRLKILVREMDVSRCILVLDKFIYIQVLRQVILDGGITLYGYKVDDGSKECKIDSHYALIILILYYLHHVFLLITLYIVTYGNKRWCIMHN